MSTEKRKTEKGENIATGLSGWEQAAEAYRARARVDTGSRLLGRYPSTAAPSKEYFLSLHEYTGDETDDENEEAAVEYYSVL